MDAVHIELKKDQNIYFTSDLHFGHRNVIRFCERPFADEKEMGKALVDNWNAVVGPDDYIFNLGDTFWFNDRHGCAKVVRQLNGIKHFVLGNHCKAKQYELYNGDDLVVHSDVTVLRIVGEKDDERFKDKRFYEIVLCHYPLACYSHSGAGALQFFGHIHSRKGQPMMEFGKPIILPSRQYMDVGCDRHDYKPVSFFDVLEEMKTYPFWELHGVKE